MTTEYAPTPKFTTSARHFARQLARILPFANDDSTYRSSLGVQLDRRGEHLLITATDRFTVATVAVTVRDWPDGVPNDWAVTLPVGLAKRIVAQWKTYPAATALTLATTADEGAGHQVEARDDAGAVIGDQFTAIQMPDNLLSFYLHDGQGTDHPSKAVGFNADYLLRFAKARQTPGDKIVIRYPDTDHSGTKPTTITVGDDFMGVIMPTRLTGGELDVAAILAGGSDE